MNKITYRQGFTLVEMAVTLTIIAILMAGLLPLISGQIEQARRKETKQQIDEIMAALVGYATAQTPPKLPCPAKASLATGATGAGISDCTLNPRTGVIPWVTLGTSETDAWGRRFTYTIASSVNGDFGTSFTLSNSGTLNVLGISTGACGNITAHVSCAASGVPAVVVSHGPNGAGAYLPTGGQLTASADADEADNSNGGATFVSHDNTPTFDDMVQWLSPNTLFNRMVAAGKLP